MEIAIIITLVITVILLSIRLYKSRKSDKKNMEYISRMRDLSDKQIELAEELISENASLSEINNELAAENQRLLADQSIKSKWVIGSLESPETPKEPGQSNKK